VMVTMREAGAVFCMVLRAPGCEGKRRESVGILQGIRMGS